MLIAVCILLLLPLSSAQGDVQATSASADYQDGMAKGLDLGSEVFRLQGAAPYNSEAASLFNQKIWEFNLVLDNTFGQGSNLSRLYRLQPYGSDEKTTTNMSANNVTSRDATYSNVTSNNITAKNVNANSIIYNNETSNNLISNNANYNNTMVISKNADDITTSINATGIAANATTNIAANKTESAIAKGMPLKSLSSKNETAGNNSEKNQTEMRAKALKNNTIRIENESSKIKDISTQELPSNITLNATNLPDDKSVQEIDAIFRDTLRNPEIPLEPMAGMPGP